MREGGLDPSPLAESRRLRRICYPVILLAARRSSWPPSWSAAPWPPRARRPWVHQTLFWAALAVQAGALWIEWRGLAANERLLVEVDRRLIAVSRRSGIPTGR